MAENLIPSYNSMEYIFLCNFCTLNMYIILTIDSQNLRSLIFFSIYRGCITLMSEWVLQYDFEKLVRFGDCYGIQNVLSFFKKKKGRNM